LLQAYRQGKCRDLIFVPVSILYDRVVEERAHLEELRGGVKKDENVGQVIRARRFLRRRHGKVYIRFGEPFSLNRYLSAVDFPEREVHREMGAHLAKAINAVSPATPLSLIAAAILTNHRQEFRLEELMETVEVLARFLKKQNRPFADSLEDPETAVKGALALLIEWEIVERRNSPTDGADPSYYVDEEKQLKLEYYKNSIIHFFIDHALAAVSVLSAANGVKNLKEAASDYEFLRDILKNEFLFERDGEAARRLASLLSYFEESSFLHLSAQGECSLTELGRKNLPIWGAMAQTFLESYWTVFRALNREKHFKRGRQENLLRNIDSIGRDLRRQGVIEQAGALSRLNFKNALSWCSALLPKTQDEEERASAAENLSRISSRLYELTNFRSRITKPLE